MEAWPMANREVVSPSPPLSPGPGPGPGHWGPLFWLSADNLHLLLPMQNEQYRYSHARPHPATSNALACRTALARLMRTCRKMHDVAGCTLYSGYFHVWHPSEALAFLKALDDEDSANGPGPGGSRSALVRHADLHNNNLLGVGDGGVRWNVEQDELTEEPWLNRVAGNLGVYFPDGWNMCRANVDGGQWDHVLEHVNQLFLRYLPGMTSLDVDMAYNWKFELLRAWSEKQQSGLFGMMPKLRHLRLFIHRGASKRTDSHRILLEAAPNLTTLEVHDSLSYSMPQLSTLPNLRTLKFHLSGRQKDAETPPPLPPGPLQPPRGPPRPRRATAAAAAAAPRGPGAAVRLPNLAAQLRTLRLDFHNARAPYEWPATQTVADLRFFTALRHLSLDTHAFAAVSRGRDHHLDVADVAGMIPEGLETLEIDKVDDGRCLRQLTRLGLVNLATLRRVGRFRRLWRVALAGCRFESEMHEAGVANEMRALFSWPGAPMVCVNGHVVNRS
ncbi:hypothetical protein Cob_v008052 [Colletotrichum orbiculare MAFF 240422]|uniref:Uncharacterized protein n=1 Tax=Colletotrichum orbiculare (strain 104-T / ATCC 96160 / CBS 514.97 / LARS 414 / MAFF 240422) TaxID=1213857 RepID=A0A484FKU8_COLOR|nr:hypothetical protein Cob_v008052 [Colletotrichum orbiculare MAFF 240422]